MPLLITTIISSGHIGAIVARELYPENSVAIYPPVLLEEEIRMYVIVSKQSQRVVCDDIYLDKQEAETSREAMEHPEELESVQVGIYD